MIIHWQHCVECLTYLPLLLIAGKLPSAIDRKTCPLKVVAALGSEVGVHMSIQHLLEHLPAQEHL